LRKTATSLQQALGRPVSVPALTAQLLNRLDAAYVDWLRDGLAPIVEFLNRHSVLSGREVTIALPRGKIAGRAEGITESGALRVLQPDGCARDIASGEVQLCRPAAAKQKGER
jgi:BirA family biotin operon repressor/biotin-[acetyl-CoA-carboxylase] ligase